MRRIAAALVAASAWACSSAAPGGGADVRPTGPVSVQVTNQNWSDVHAYVLVGGQRQSLGVITTTNSRTFELSPQMLMGQRGVTFIGLPIGSRLAYVSEELLVAPGDRVVWTIHNNLQQSTVSIF